MQNQKSCYKYICTDLKNATKWIFLEKQVSSW